MNADRPVIRYATGEIAQVGDHVDEDGWEAVVEDVIATADDQARWGLDEPGPMLRIAEAGLVFEPRDSYCWGVLVLLSREEWEGRSA